MKKLILALAVVLASLPAHADIVWGVAGPYTGQLASYGESMQAAIRLAAEEINAAGGINGQKIQIKAYDDACDPKQAVAVANKIISENIPFVFQGSCSASTMAAARTYSDEGRLVFTTLASNPKVTDDGGPLMFRGIYRDDQAASVVADEIIKHHHAMKLAIIHDKSAYGQGVAELLRARLRQGGVNELLFEPYNPGDHDYSALVTRLKQSGADGVFIGGFPIEAAMITRQLREAGSSMQILAGDLSSPDYPKIAGKNSEGALFVFPTDPRKVSSTQNVIAKLQKMGIAVDGYALYAYASAQALAQASVQAASTDPAKVAAVLHKNTFDTILGKWSFDEKGDVRDIHQIMYRWNNGQYEELKQ
jgi:branched-chain amino acid transport system substrate-binding protein